MDDLFKKLTVLMRARLRTLVRPKSVVREASPRPKAQPQSQPDMRSTPSLEPVLDEMQHTIDRLNQMQPTKSDEPAPDDELAGRIDRLSRR
ncbi:MAG: hypothetical protein SGJ24_01590 [Chloroflexota bacterium]|nr:hypothetical protein [Chloroflexota bacterium]